MAPLRYIFVDNVSYRRFGASQECIETEKMLSTAAFAMQEINAHTGHGLLLREMFNCHLDLRKGRVEKTCQAFWGGSSE